MKKASLLFLCALAFLPITAYSQLTPDPSRYPVDSAYVACLAVPDNQTTLGMVDCAIEAHDAWDRELNRYYKLLLTILSPEEKEKLRIAQRNWLAYRDSEITFYRTTYGNLLGTMWQIVAAERGLEIVRQRAIELQTYYDVLMEEK
jgi:uncharacterized protein YecT (DUF1311 family)